MKNPTFRDDKKRKIFCSGCKRYLTDLYLEEKKDRFIKCKKCGIKSHILPPEHSNDGEMKVLKFGVGGSMYTADPEFDEY